MSGGADPDVMDAIERGNAVVFFDVVLGEGANSAELGRIKLELFVKDVSVITWLVSLFVIVLCHDKNTNMAANAAKLT